MKRLAVVLGVGWLVLAGGTANAAPILTLTSGGTTITVNDNAVGLDLNLLPGVIVYSGPVGAIWSVNVSTGLTKPLVGTATQPRMDLNSVNNSSTAGTLTIRFSDDGFNYSGPMFMEIGGTTDGTVRYTAYSGVVEIGSLFFDASPFAGTDSGAGYPGAFTQEVLLTHDASGVSSFDAGLRVPEPGSMLFFGTGLLGLVAARRKWRG